MSGEQQLPKKLYWMLQVKNSSQNHTWHAHLRQNFKTETQGLVSQLNEHGFKVNPLTSHMANMFA